MEKFMESSMGEMSTKVDELSQTQDVVDRKVIDHEKKHMCTFLKEENLREEKVKSDKKMSHQKEESALESELVNNSNNHFLACFSPIMQKFEAQNMENTGSLGYKLYKTIRNLMVNIFTCELALDIDHMLKCSSSCAYFEKQLLVSVARIKPYYYDLDFLYDNLFFDLLVGNFLSSCASMWSKIHIFFRSFVKSGYDDRVSWFPWSLRDFDGFIPSIQFLCFVNNQIKYPHDEQKVLIVDEF
ncbi:hypothetical protein M9H77_07215 [Catharanthus roseus]|uniref:Uncharacterized protein n=1 Tax=Catharanthus roseus TaxID=4058 RepID=A0ACC0BUA8_CATRO|nr:hypothetical protein M9H77_07215 [Catharanthus roseus]